jgi:hypothetical protein
MMTKIIINKLLIIFLLSFVSAHVQADLRIDFGYGFTQSSKNIATSDDVLGAVYDGSLGLSITRKGSLFLTVGYLYIDLNEPFSQGVTATTNALNPYIGFNYEFDQAGLISFGIFASPYAEARFKRSDSVEERWLGSSTYAKFSAGYAYTPSLILTFSISYFGGQYDTRDSASQVSSVNSFEWNTVIPMIGFRYKWVPEQ